MSNLLRKAGWYIERVRTPLHPPLEDIISSLLHLGGGFAEKVSALINTRRMAWRASRTDGACGFYGE